jgi:hypothetical protein
MPGWVKPLALCLVVLLAGALGALFNRRCVGLTRTGGVLIICSALVSVAAVWSAVRWGQMPDDQADLKLYAQVFGVQSAYGWITLLAMIGIRKPM